ncbi:MAG TPA: TonB family protein [Acidocella sp.]|nr:TonB family protein [Acidocella sp.]
MQVTAKQHFQDWDAPELGLPKATFIAIVLVALICALLFAAALGLKPKAPPPAIQVTQATLTSLPQPTPPPKVVPPPKPIPAVIPKPPPVPSKIVVATKPPPPVRHVMKQPPPKPVMHHTEAPTKPIPPQPAAPVSAAAPAAHPAPPAAAPTSGIGPYGAAMHSIIQANQNVPPALAQLGISGTAVIKIEVAPSGQVIGASVVRSSGNPLIDQTALEHARDAHFPPFNNEMPGAALTFEVPVQIMPGDGGGDSD